MCVCLFASSCLANDHVCPDYAEMEQTLNEGVEKLKSLPSIDALPCQKAPKGVSESVQYVLETYGDFLSKTNQQKRSDEIYTWARNLNTSSKEKVAK